MSTTAAQLVAEAKSQVENLTPAEVTQELIRGRFSSTFVSPLSSPPLA